MGVLAISTHKPSAVDVDGLSRDVAVPRKHHQYLGDLARRSESSNWDVVSPRVGIGGHHVRLNQRRGDSVDRDAFLRQMPRVVVRQPVHAGL